MWNKRYAQKEYVYGTTPNEFLKTQLQNIKVGKILFPAEGEGRNAVYASTLGWNVSAFDISTEGKKKAEQLAEIHKAKIDYQVGELPNLNYQPEQFDAIVLIYAHFPIAIRRQYHQLLNTYLKKGGLVIFEGFSKEHLKFREENPKLGPPPTLEMLFSLEEIQTDFSNFESLILKEQVIELNEGLYHNGKGSVIRFVGIKK